jgi:hypothetical protein
VQYASVGCEPTIMGIGPAPAIQAILSKTNLDISSISRFEVNEAFAAQYLAVEKELGLDRNKVNLHGGAISLDANGAPSNFTLASTAGDNDLTIAVTGATDSSLILSSSGTGNDALQLTASAGGMDITSAKAMDITTSANNANITIDPHGSGSLALGSADNTAVTVDALAITLTSVNALTLTDGTASLILGGTGATSLAAATTVDLDCSGAMSLNSSGGAINVGNDAVAQAINIGTGGAARTITVGNTTGATALDVNLGTGSIALASTGTRASAIALTASHATGGIILTSGGDIPLCLVPKLYLLQMLILYHQ